MKSRKKIRIAVQLQPIHTTYAELRSALGQAEAMGVDIVFNSDHFFPAVGDDNGACFEAWTMLGAWGEQTSKVGIGVSVSGNTYRNANLLADMARTVDHISDGRAILGIGSGWFGKDHEQYGFEFPGSEQRVQDLEASLAAIAARLPRLNPPPVQERLPIMIGNGGDRKPPEMVARYADIWMDFKPLDIVAAYNSQLDDACRAIGRDPAKIERGIAMDTLDLARFEAFRACGCTLFMVRYIGPNFDLTGLDAVLSWRDTLNTGL